MKAILPTLLVIALLPVVARAQTTRTVLTTADSGAGSLRQAVADSADGDTIVFAEELSGGTIVLTSGYIHVLNAVTIDASALPGGITISGNHTSRIFIVGDGPTLFDSLTLIDGRAPDGTSGSNGGYGGGIFQNGSQLLTLRDCVISGCRTGDGGDATGNGNLPGLGGHGGAIYTAYSPLVLERTILRGNRTGDSGVQLGSTTRDASGGYGGGIYAYSSDVTLIESTIADNETGTAGIGGSGGEGGGIWIFLNVNLTVVRSTISGNRTGNGGNGNGIENLGSIAPGAGGQAAGIFMSQLSGARIENSTIANNVAGDAGTNGALGPGFPGAGGAIAFRVTHLELISSTVVGNRSGEGIGTEYTGGIYVKENARLTIADSIVAGNHSETQTGDLADVFKYSNGMVVTEGGNFIGENTNVESEFPEPGVAGEANANGDFTGTGMDPLDHQLGVLGDNGGPTETMAPLPGSPVIDPEGGDTTSTFDTDQRGKVRIYNGTLDIGAVEHLPDYGPLVRSLKSKIRGTERALRKAKQAGKISRIAALKKKLRRFRQRLASVPSVP